MREVTEWRDAHCDPRPGDVFTLGARRLEVVAVSRKGAVLALEDGEKRWLPPWRFRATVTLWKACHGVP